MSMGARSTAAGDVRFVPPRVEEPRVENPVAALVAACTPEAEPEVATSEQSATEETSRDARRRASADLGAQVLASRVANVGSLNARGAPFSDPRYDRRDAEAASQLSH